MDVHGGDRVRNVVSGMRMRRQGGTEGVDERNGEE